jgi:hypothetical protein
LLRNEDKTNFLERPEIFGFPFLGRTSDWLWDSEVSLLPQNIRKLTNWRSSEPRRSKIARISKSVVKTVLMFSRKISSFRCRVVDTFALHGCYAAYVGVWLPTFRETPSVWSLRVKQSKKNCSWLGLLHPWRWERYVVPKRRWPPASLRRVTSRRAATLVLSDIEDIFH